MRAAQLEVKPLSLGKQVWETNPFLRSVFDRNDGQELKRPRISIEHGTARSSTDSARTVPDITKQISLHVPRVRPETKHLVSSNPEAGRQQAINAWLQIIKIDLNESLTGRQILKFLRIILVR